jgi:hypothetical protein
MDRIGLAKIRFTTATSLASLGTTRFDFHSSSSTWLAFRLKSNASWLHQPSGMVWTGGRLQAVL